MIKVCVLFNIAALHSQIAASQSMSLDEGVKAAIANFQSAASAFRQLASLVPAFFKSPPTNDLQPALLTALSELMLAQVRRDGWCFSSFYYIIFF
jgi:programmed cell death 6-interacting protein